MEVRPIMKSVKSLLFVFVAVFAFSIASCATGEKPVTEVEPTADQLEKEQMEEVSRLEQEELDALKRDESLQDEVRSMDFVPGELVNVYFDFDRYNLKPEAKAALENNAEWIKANPDKKIQIEGHCDERGTEEYNLALGEKRATTTKAYLVSLGVNDNDIYTISYGEEKPVDTDHTQEAWAKNRRAEFKVTEQ